MKGFCRVCGAEIAAPLIFGQSDQERHLALGQVSLQHVQQSHPDAFAQLVTGLAQLQTIIGLYVLTSTDEAFLSVRDTMRQDAVAYFSKPDVLASPPPQNHS